MRQLLEMTEGDASQHRELNVHRRELRAQDGHDAAKLGHNEFRFQRDSWISPKSRLGAQGMPIAADSGTPAGLNGRNAMKMLFVTGVMTLIASHAFAQTPDSMPPPTRSTAGVEASLATPTGNEVSAGVASYTYQEPGAQAISIHGAKFVADYIGTLSLNKGRHWFAQADLRGTIGSAAYNGWCSPFLITPDSDVAEWLCARCGRFVAVQRDRRQGRVPGSSRPRRQGPDRTTMGVVALYRCGSSSFVEWHDGHSRIPNGRLSLPASRCDVARQRRFAWDAEPESGIRSPDPRLATDPRLEVGRRRCSSDDRRRLRSRSMALRISRSLSLEDGHCAQVRNIR